MPPAANAAARPVLLGYPWVPGCCCGFDIGIVCAAGGVGSVPNAASQWFRSRGAGRESVRVEVAYQTGLKRKGEHRRRE